MKKNYKFTVACIVFAVASLFTPISLLAQNVGINGSGAVPAASAMLDVDATNKGLLIPRVALTATNLAGPIAAPATSLLVYNTATASAGATAVSPGYYYNGGTPAAPNWTRFSTGNKWDLLGNAATTAPVSAIGTAISNNFIGTTDAIDFAIATNGFERFRIKSDNASQLRIGAGTSFTVNLNTGSTPSLFHLHDWGTTANDFAVINLSSATVANGNRTGVINFAATAATNERRAASIESYLTAASGTNVTGDLRFFTNNNNSYTEKMRVEAGGNVGIGTPSPGYRLDLNTGTFAFGNSNVRTETRNDAGLQGNAGAQSGFFETSSPTNYPAGATSWWHLIDTRHSNNGNNYALQLSGSFFDQKIYFRKTNNNAAQPWSELLSSANNPVSVSLATDYTVNTAAWANIAPMTVTFVATKTTALVQFTSSGFAYTNSMGYVQFRVRNSTSGTTIGGTNTNMQAYDDVTGTLTNWSCAFSKNITGLTPGTSYTLIIQAQRGGILGTYDAAIYAATNSDAHHMTLTVFP
jgi:hypothetical protein